MVSNNEDIMMLAVSFKKLNWLYRLDHRQKTLRASREVVAARAQCSVTRSSKHLYAFQPVWNWDWDKSCNTNELQRHDQLVLVRMFKGTQFARGPSNWRCTQWLNNFASLWSWNWAQWALHLWLDILFPSGFSNTLMPNFYLFEIKE